MALVFVSYSWKDLDISNRVRVDLMLNGIAVWRDKEDIRKDKSWDHEIEQILYSGRLTHFLFLETTNSVNDLSVCRDELAIATDMRIPILRMCFGTTITTPLRLVRKTYVDFRVDYKVGLSNLLNELAKTTGRSVLVPRLGQPSKQRTPTKNQVAAAQEQTPLVRLVAGPGTGKSFAIEERVRWLLASQIPPKSICVVSFTRASSRDLKNRIAQYCEQHSQERADEVSVTTLHSLALRILRKKKLLQGFPAMPKVLDEWEVKRIFDEEFSVETHKSPTRSEEIRLAWEAYWCTGQWDVPEYLKPKQPVMKAELDAFETFLTPTTQVYSCLLPGQLIQRAVDAINANLIDPVEVLGTRFLIVDEFQDLNFTDLEFIKAFVRKGTSVFVAGDDDQSIYAFRHAYPTGLQQFVSMYPQAATHELSECFRCTPEVLKVARNLIQRFPSYERIPKHLFSQYEIAQPSLKGSSHRWKFRSEKQEANAIASSCRSLIERGLPPQDILILLSKREAFLTPLEVAFASTGVQVEIGRFEPYINTDAGRFAYSLVRIACDTHLEDYVAHRTMLGLLPRVGIATCNSVRRSISSHPLNYLDVFYNPFYGGWFNQSQRKAIDQARNICADLKDWSDENSLEQRQTKIAQYIETYFGESEAALWSEQVKGLPANMSLAELLAYLELEYDDQRSRLLKAVYDRLELPIPSNGFFPPKVRIMTMHGIKGLEAKVVFIPGLEEAILPGAKTRRYPSLVQEAARLLYVSITRAKAAVIMSFSMSRLVHGQREFDRAPSQFNIALNGAFTDKAEEGLNTTDIDEILQTVSQL